jgi:hypothetical protein
METVMARSRPDRSRRKPRRHGGDPALALWRQWRHWTSRVERLSADSGSHDRDLETAVRKAFGAEDRLAVTSAVSLAGIRGKLEIYAFYAHDLHLDGAIADRLVASVIADLERLAGHPG